MSDKIDAIIVDIDGTLADNMHRQHLAPKRGTAQGVGAIHLEPSWRRFFDAMHLDVPVPAVRLIVNKFYPLARVILCTGRSERFRRGTEEWMTTHNVMYDVMHMRADDDYRKDEEVKQDMLNRILVNHNVLFSIDDREEVVAMWRRNGITTFALPDTTKVELP